MFDADGAFILPGCLVTALALVAVVIAALAVLL